MNELELLSQVKLPNGTVYEVWSFDYENARIYLRPARQPVLPPEKRWWERLLGR